MKTVVVCGKGTLAVKILEWFLGRPTEYKIICVVPVKLDEQGPEDWASNKLVDIASAHKIPIVESGKIEDIKGINKSDFQCDIMQVCFYKSIIKKWAIKKFKYILNIHLADLPKYRGSRSINWALKNEEHFQGVTIHLLDEKLDHGAILSQMKFTIYPYYEEVIDVYERALDYSYNLFTHTLPNLEKIIPLEQDHKMASYYSSKDFAKLGDRLTFTKELSKEILK
jgi:methionyl-tRNA formyltransferase